MDRNPWTKEQITILKGYPSSPKQVIIDLIPNHSWISIAQKARELGLHRSLEIINQQNKERAQLYSGDNNPTKRPEVRAKLSALALARPKLMRYCKVCGEPAVWKEMLGAESFPSYEAAKKAGLTWEYYCEKHMAPNMTKGYFRKCAGIKFPVHPKVLKRARQQYELTHHKEMLKYRSDYVLQHYIRSSVNGKRVKIRAEKRPRPVSLICELCEQGPRRLGYHHWNGEKPFIGLWLCRTCHIAVTKYHQGLIQKYLLLQQQIEGPNDLHATL